MENFQLKQLNIENVVTDINGIRWSPYISLKTMNYLLISANYVSFDVFNLVCKDLVERMKKYTYSPFSFTRSGGISRKLVNYGPYRYALRKSGTFAELIIRDERGTTRLLFTNTLTGTEVKFKLNKENKGEEVIISGKKALGVIIDELKKDGIDLYDYKISRDEGEKIHAKDNLLNPRMIKIMDESLVNKTINNCHHLDLNSAYAAGIAKKFPEFYPALNRLYNLRKTLPGYKHILTNAIGAMESKYTGYKWSHIAAAGHEWTNEQMTTVLRILSRKGAKPLMLNVDGIWYYSDEPLDINNYEFGAWKNDHINCTFRMKSTGAYEYIEDGKYKVVQKGLTKFDAIKPDRTTWEWGDLYNENNDMNIIIKAFDLGEYPLNKEFIGLVRFEKSQQEIAKELERKKYAS